MKILKMLGYYTEEEIKKYKDDYELQKQVSLDLIHELNEQQKVMDAILRENAMLKSDPEQYIELKIAERELEVCNNPTRHKAYALGRQDTFAEWGAKRLEWWSKNYDIAIVEDDKLIPIMTLNDLEDVKAVDTNMVTDDGIIIDDLTEMGA